MLSEMLRKEADRATRYNPGSLEQLLENWTDDEVEAAFRESINSPAGLFASEVEASLASLLYEEWLRRNFDAALAWFNGTKDLSLKHAMVTSVSDFWPQERADEGIDFAVANAELFISSRVWLLFGKIMTNRAARGPRAVDDFLRSIREGGIEPRFDRAISIPDGFDFHAFSESPEFTRLYESGNAAAILRAWSRQNKDEAFDWLLQSQGPTALLTLAVSPEWVADTELKWLGGKMSDLQPAQRNEFYDAMLEQWMEMPGEMRAFADGIDDPELLRQIHELSIQSIYAGNARDVFPFIEALGDSAERIDILKTAEPASLFITRPDLRNFNKSTEGQLVGKLRKWDATPEEIQKIVERFKE